jgi:hypothetical protein
MVLSLMLLNLAGGTCVEDMRRLEGDEGCCRVLRRVEQKGMKRRGAVLLAARERIQALAVLPA